MHRGAILQRRRAGSGMKRITSTKRALSATGTACTEVMRLQEQDMFENSKMLGAPGFEKYFAYAKHPVCYLAPTRYSRSSSCSSCCDGADFQPGCQRP